MPPRCTHMLAGTIIAMAASSSLAATDDSAQDPSPPIPVDRADTPENVPPVQRDNRFLEEVVVTAQRREESMQVVPISVQAFSGDLLDARGVTEPKALQFITPGLQYNIFAGYSLIYIRGVGTDAFIPSADASVATYIDNVYYPFGHSLAAALGTIERVEVLKGPQGTLFGRNSTGGAINIVTRQPGQNLESNVLVSRERFDKTNVRAFASIPLHDTFAVSVSGLHYSQDNHYELAPDSPRTDLPSETSRGVSLRGKWSPLDNLSATVGYNWINTRGTLAQMLPVAEVKPLGALLGVGLRQQSDYKTSEDAPTYIDTRARVLTANIEYSVPWFDVRLIGGDQRIDSPALADYDGSAQPLVSFEALGQFADVKTGEFQILSNDGSPWSDRLEWIGGVYYIDSSAGYDPLLFSAAPGVLSFLSNPPPGGLLDALSGLTVPLIDGLGQISDALGLPLDDFLNNGVTLNLQGVLDTQSTAFFAQGTGRLTDRLSLTLGGRYQSETRTLAKSTTRAALNPNDPHQVIPVFNFGSRRAKTSNFSPRAVLDFKFGDASMGYLSYNRGFKSGTFNIIAIYTPTQFIEPEEVTTYELGYKGTLFGGAMRLNAAAFFNQIDNLQVQTISLTSGGAVRFETAGEAEIKGADFDLLWEVFPNALPGLVFTAGGAYLDGTYTDYPEGSGFDETTGLFFDGTIFPNRDFTGNRIVRTPRFSGNAGLAYSFDAGNGTFEIGGDVYYNSGSYYSAQNSASSKEDAYHMINLRGSYIHHPWNLRVSAFGDNINDGRNHLVIAELDFGTARLLGPPAVYGVRLQWDFR